MAYRYRTPSRSGGRAIERVPVPNVNTGRVGD